MNPGNYLKKAAEKKLNPDKLQKAVLFRVTRSGARTAQIFVQFNPSEYSISRQIQYGSHKAVGKDEKSTTVQVVTASQSVLQVALHFDSYTDLNTMQLKDIAAPKALAQKALKMPFPDVHEKVNNCVQEILDLIEFMPEEHGPPHVEFLWGDTDFVGRVMHSQVRYTMFDQSGVPVRATVQLAIIGMDVVSEINRISKPPESPDRSKQRLLTQGEPIWMLAQKEYGDPGMWKTIARENGILNPRLLGDAIRLQVPSL